MKNSWLLLTLLLAPSARSSELPSPSFEDLRYAQTGARVVPVDYRVQNNPFFIDPGWLPPPNIPEDKVEGLLKRLEDLDKKNGGKGLGENERQRLVGRLVEIDRYYVDPVDQKRWEGILQSMGDVAEKELGTGKADWGVLVDKMLKHGTGELKDPHSQYFDVEETKKLEEFLSGKFSGIGAVLKNHEEGAQIERVIPGSPAEKAGLKEGDVVTAVDGVPIKGTDLQETVKRVRGVKGTEVQLTVGVEDPRTLKPVRGDVKMPNVLAKMAKGDIGYIYLSQFEEGSDEAVFQAIEQLKAQGMKKLILDVRGDPGGSVDVVGKIASEFLKNRDVITSFHVQGKWRDRLVTRGDGKYAKLPVAVMIDSGSASASEILAAALQDNKAGALVVGSRSYGKGTQQAVTGEPSGRVLKLTQSRWHTPKGAALENRHDPATGEAIPQTGGVVPNAEVVVPEEQEGKILKEIYLQLYKRPLPPNPTEDPALQKAIELLERKGVS